MRVRTIKKFCGIIRKRIESSPDKKTFVIKMDYLRSQFSRKDLEKLIDDFERYHMLYYYEDRVVIVGTSRLDDTKARLINELRRKRIEDFGVFFTNALEYLRSKDFVIFIINSIVTFILGFVVGWFTGGCGR